MCSFSYKLLSLFFRRYCFTDGRSDGAVQSIQVYYSGSGSDPSVALCLSYCTLQMIASIRIAFIWALYKRRKLLRIRQKKTDERAAMKVRMRRIRGKDATMGSVALKRFHRVSQASS